MKIEYKVRPVTRYIVTKYEESDNGGSCSQQGEYNNGESAYLVAYALAQADARRLGLPPGDETVMFPEIPEGVHPDIGVRY
jgi:hypothetical protein